MGTYLTYTIDTNRFVVFEAIPKRILLSFITSLVILSLLVSFGCSTTSANKKDKMNMSNGQNFSYQGNNITYYEKGSGNIILLIHGFGASSYTWRYVTEALFANNKLITIDLKGFGLSDKPMDDKYSIEDQSDIIINFIKEQHLYNITLVGNSFGGAVALFTAIKLIELGDEQIVRNMILIDSAGYSQDFPYFISVLRTPLLSYLSLALLPNKLNTRMLLTKAFYDDSKITDEMLDIYSSYLSLPGAYHALISTANQIIPKNFDSVINKYKQIKVPVLAIWGENDEIVPIAVGQRLSEDIPNVKLKVISNCGHVPQEECPTETIKLINAFLAESGGS